MVSLAFSVQPLVAEALPWPTAAADSDLWKVPHQILRWIHKDDNVDALLDAANDSPLYAWLTT